jgi:hypothetical protein
MNVVECPEFRALIPLLCEDLNDNDIPHQTKLREAIIRTWKMEFEKLQADIHVSALWPCLLGSL